MSGPAPPLTPAERRLGQWRSALNVFEFAADRCAYCGSQGQYQDDHFPIPKVCGGSVTVRACLHCHNLKDRLSHDMAWDYLLSHSDQVDSVVLTPWELAFVCGGASLLPRAIISLVGDFADYPAALRVMIARRLREQFLEMRSSA